MICSRKMFKESVCLGIDIDTANKASWGSVHTYAFLLELNCFWQKHTQRRIVSSNKIKHFFPGMLSWCHSLNKLNWPLQVQLIVIVFWEEITSWWNNWQLYKEDLSGWYLLETLELNHIALEIIKYIIKWPGNQCKLCKMGHLSSS